MSESLSPSVTDAPPPQLALQKVYIKDVSFETPHAPQIFQELGEAGQPPQIQLNLGHKVNELGEGLFEVVLNLTLTCTLNGRTAYLVEVEQAGVFGISGFGEVERAGILGSYCPNVLFPYARQIVSFLIQEGGFPPFLLQPINFDALYAEQQRQLVGDEPHSLNS